MTETAFPILPGGVLASQIDEAIWSNIMQRRKWLVHDNPQHERRIPEDNQTTTDLAVNFTRRNVFSNKGFVNLSLSPESDSNFLQNLNPAQYRKSRYQSQS